MNCVACNETPRSVGSELLRMPWGDGALSSRAADHVQRRVVSRSDAIDKEHKGLYDFFYLPIDYSNKCNVGYAFVNFIDPQSIVAFCRYFNGRGWPDFNSTKICQITYARVQGKHEMINRFRNSNIMRQRDQSLHPLVFYSAGKSKGEPEPFPAPIDGWQHSRQGSSARDDVAETQRRGGAGGRRARGRGRKQRQQKQKQKARQEQDE